MLLHTIVPPEQIFAGENSAAYEYKRVNNSLVQGVARDGRFTVERLISTDPSMYLNPRYSPGGRL